MVTITESGVKKGFPYNSNKKGGGKILFVGRLILLKQELAFKVLETNRETLQLCSKTMKLSKEDKKIYERFTFSRFHKKDTWP